VITTAVLAVLAAALQVLTASAAAFALARLRFPGRRALVRTIVVLAAVPALVLVVPRFVMVDSWGWSDSFTGLAAPALVSAGAILFLYQVFRMLPREPEESAKLDGAGPWMVFSRVVAPQARPALAVVAGFAVLAQWRSLLWPLAVSRRLGPEVAEQGIARRIVEGAGGLSVPQLLAVGVVIAVPAVAVAALVALSRARSARAFERELPGEVSPLTPGPFEHQIL
jgi:multiple sugar transport system permease protein